MTNLITTEEEKEENKISPNYNLVSTQGVVKMAFNLREEIMRLPTDRYYIDSKNGFAYVKSVYMDDMFKKIYPLHQIEIVNKTVTANTWISYDVIIKAFIGREYISNPGTGGARIQIPADIGKIIKQYKADGKFKERHEFIMTLTPLDWIDFGNDCKSALTKAIANAQSRFGVAADIYNKGILPEETRIQMDRIVEFILKEKIVNPMEKVQVKQEWNKIKLDKKNMQSFFFMLAEKYEVNSETIIE